MGMQRYDGLDRDRVPEDRELVDAICRNSDAIMEKLDENTLSKYFWLMDRLSERDVSRDEEYRRKFGAYYRMRFASGKFRDEFFVLFEKLKTEKEPSFRSAAEHLYEVSGEHQFSFISKMLHTIDPTHPIYDSQVARVLGLKRIYSGNIGKRLDRDMLILDEIRGTYECLLSEPALRGLVKRIDDASPGKMSDEKKFDFILWALGGLGYKKK